MTLTESSGKVVQPCRGAEVIARVPAGVEQRDELVPCPFTSAGNRVDPGSGERAVGALGNRDRNAGTEESRGEEPAFHLGWVTVEVDAELGGEPTAQRIHQDSHQRGTGRDLSTRRCHHR